MEPYRVFVSSIMNPSIEELLPEREAARAAVEHFAPLATAWAFEAEPASPKPLLDFYIDAVKSSDLFVLILGTHVTKPVQDEYRAAQDHNNPMLAFCKAVPFREPETESLLRSFHAKYEAFGSAIELREKIRRALGLHLLAIIRGDDGQTPRHGDRIARLRTFARDRRELKVFPTVPCRHNNSFRVYSVEHAAVVFTKSNGENITVPVERIEDVLDSGASESAIVQLNGRLQWLTLRERWRFFPEKPPSPDALCAGLGKQLTTQGVLANRIYGELRNAGYGFRWSNPENVPNADVFFDEDGSHVTNGRQILVCWKGQLS
jgi:hypothetical protein